MARRCSNRLFELTTDPGSDRTRSNMKGTDPTARPSTVSWKPMSPSQRSSRMHTKQLSAFQDRGIGVTPAPPNRCRRPPERAVSTGRGQNRASGRCARRSHIRFYTVLEDHALPDRARRELHHVVAARGRADRRARHQQARLGSQHLFDDHLARLASTAISSICSTSRRSAATAPLRVAVVSVSSNVACAPRLTQRRAGTLQRTVRRSSRADRRCSPIVRGA